MKLIHISDAAAEILGHREFSIQGDVNDWCLLAVGGDGATPAFTEHYAAITARAEELDGPQAADVIAERERRLALGFDHDFGDARGVHHIGTTPDDMRKWLDEVNPLSQALINTGNPNTPIGISTNTGEVMVTATEWQAILIGAGVWRQPIYQASFALLAMDPIPADYADDSYWTPG